MLTEVTIWKGAESLKRFYTFFMTSFPYTDPNKEITSSSGSFKSHSSNNVEFDMSASREEGDANFSMDGGGFEEATCLPFLLYASWDTLRKGGHVAHNLQLSISLIEGRG